MLFFQDTTKSISIFPSETLKIDSLQIGNAVNQRLYSLYELGYLAAENKIIYKPENKVEVQFFANQIFVLADLSGGNVSEEILNKIGYDSRIFNNKAFSYHRLVKVLNSILDYAENHGYPFASVKLDSIEIEDNKLKTWLNYNSGPIIVFDSLVIDGYDKVKTKYLMTHLGIYQGDPYEEKLIKEISNKLKLLPFISLKESPDVTSEMANAISIYSYRKMK